MQKRRRVMLYRKIYGDNYFTKICNDLTIPYHTIITTLLHYSPTEHFPRVRTQLRSRPGEKSRHA
jgi:hypothetical protein